MCPINSESFANRVTKTRHHYTTTPPGGSLKTYYIREEYAYDDASRLRFTRHSIKTTASLPAATDWVITSAPLFDELNRLQEKRLHMSNFDGSWPVNLSIPPTNTKYLQNLDYTYNIRGWLTGINDPTSCATQSGDDLPDLFSMGLDYESTANGATAQYNGNIAAMQWRSNVNGSCLTRQQYRFTYDYANRLLTANHFTHNGTTWVNTNNYSESGITYDLNGNLKGYTRRGQMPDLSFNVIDNLTYTYNDAARPDRLTNMSDAGSATKGFKYKTGAAAYQYDLNGNLTQDNHKSLTFQYNYLNLPNYISDAGGADMSITYTADGEKLTKISSAGTRNYVSGIEYLGSNLEAIYHSEGRCTPNGTSAFYYEYTIKDHLGNARVNFRANGAAVTFLQELHYYPFGMLMEGIGTAKVTDNAYKYNSKELNEDLGLNLSDYGARWYDAALGRWWSVDPLGEKFGAWSGYNYGVDNPIRFIDPDGMVPDNVIINGPDAEMAVAALNETSKLKITRDAETGMLSSEGKAKTKAEKKLLKAIKDPSRLVVLETTTAQTYDDPKDGTNNNVILPGGYMGSEVVEKDGKKGVTGHQKINMDIASKVASVIGEKTGETVMHEINEAYFGTILDPGGSYPTGFQKSHDASKSLDRLKNGDFSINTVKRTTLDGSTIKVIQIRVKPTDIWTDVMTIKK